MKKRLPDWLERVERFVDYALPFMLVLLAILIVLEFFKIAEKYHDVILWLDYGVIAFFVIDLCFKWYHTRNVLKFIKLYWIDIIAVFPFYTVFRFYLAASEFIVAGEQAQKFLHEAVLVRETKLLREAEFASKVAKEGRVVRMIARGLRVLRARWYVTHWHLQKVSKGYREEHQKKTRNHSTRRNAR